MQATRFTRTMKPITSVSLVAVMIGALGCGGSGSDTDIEEGQPSPTRTAAPTQASGCQRVPAALREALQGSLQPGRRLGRVAAVHSQDVVETGPRDLAEGLYYVTGDVRPSPGLTTWAVGQRAFNSGGGIIIGVGPAARAVSEAGVDIPSATLETWGLTPVAAEYQASQDCLASQD